MPAEIITIGNELLEGRVTDTNATWIADRLTLAGLAVKRISSVPDCRGEVAGILEEAERRSDVIIVGGGLGPTHDDVTKAALCDFFGTHLVENKSVLENIKQLLRKKQLPLNKNNRRQAEIPANADPVMNPLGTAPGLWMEKEKKIFVVIPGVPFEMENIVEKEIIPRLTRSLKLPAHYQKTIVTSGSFEAMLADILRDFENELPENVTLAYLPSPGIIRLRLGARDQSMQKAKESVEGQAEKLKKIIPQYIVGYNEETLEMIVGNMLKANNKTLCTIESCTGGKISSMLVSVPGCSQYFKGGIVVYSNELKTGLLNIDDNILSKYGAVSKQTVEAMAVNGSRIMQTDYSVAISGIAGPDGGTPQKPAGMVCIAVNTPRGCFSDIFYFGDNRERNIKRASVTALNMLRKNIKT